MKLFAVTSDNDEWPEDRQTVTVLVAAPDGATAIELVKADKEYDCCYSDHDATEVPNASSNRRKPTILTHFWS